MGSYSLYKGIWLKMIIIKHLCVLINVCGGMKVNSKKKKKVFIIKKLVLMKCIGTCSCL